MTVPRVFEQVRERHGWNRRGSEIEIPVGEGRTQSVAVETFEHDGVEMLRITTGVGKATMLSPERMGAALRVNNGLAHGALAIREDRLVMTDTFAAHDVTPAQAERSVLFVASTADRYEKVLFGTDEH
jgi:hypothetical protein